MNNIKLHKKQLNIMCKRTARKLLAEDEKTKRFVEDLKLHFKKDKWSLDYILHVEMFAMLGESAAYNHLVFNQILKKLKLKTSYDKKSDVVVIKK